MTVLITLTLAGADTGPFSLYSDLDGFLAPFETGVLKTALQAGYTSVVVPDGSTVIRVQSNSSCTNYVDFPISGITTTTTSTSSTTSTTSSTTTATPIPTCTVYAIDPSPTELEASDDNLIYFAYTNCNGVFTTQSFNAADYVCVQELSVVSLYYFVGESTTICTQSTYTNTSVSCSSST